MSWLDPVRAALDGAERPLPVFFRDDDAGWADERLIAMLDVFDRYAVAVDLAVIPAKLHPCLVANLTTRLSRSALRVHQHGFAHVNHESTERKHEFGPSRAAGAQARDIRAGHALMREAFGDRGEPVFTPPWNRCTPETAGVLAAEGFRVLSRDSTAPRAELPGLVEIPVTVDWFGHRKGVRWTRDELAERIAAALTVPEPAGLMLHHAVTDAAELAAVEAIVALLAGHPAARLTTIVELAA